MLNFCSLYSGSTGNCLFVKSNNSNILIDAGVSTKKIVEALDSINTNINNIDAILVTHEHVDHTKSISSLSSKYNIPVYANLETWNSLSKHKEKINIENQKIFNVSEKFKINDIEIQPFSIPHDAANPCGFNIFKDGKKISIATDIGHMTNGILKNLEDSIFVLLESNYDPEVLKFSRYPYPLKSRIAGPNGHLSNEVAGKTINHLLKFGLQQAMLGHLSKESNFPELAYKTVLDEIVTSSNYNENTFKLSVASRDIPGKIYPLEEGK